MLCYDICTCVFLFPDIKYVFICGKEYVVGRKDCDIVITGDAAVSRKHAILHVTHSDAHLVITLLDCVCYRSGKIAISV